MPVSNFGLGLAAVGLAATGGAVAAFRRKLTTPFKVAYALAWPTLGSAILIIGHPGYESQVKTLEKTGVLDSEGNRLSEIQESKALAMQKMMEAAKSEKSW